MVATAGHDTTLSPEQLALRASGITATDIAAIVGVHPYRSAVDVWSDKAGISQPFAGNDRTKWGNILEPVLRKDYEERMGVRVETRGTLSHDDFEWMKATPDGLVYEGAEVEPDRGLEIKCHTIHLAYLYGQPGTDEIPQYELCQVAWNMAVTELQRWDLVAFIDGQTRDYAIDRDQELIDMLYDRAAKFRRDHVQTGNPPPPDGTEAYTEWLNARHNADNALATLVRVEGEQDVMNAVQRLQELRDEIATLETQEGLVVQTLKARIGNHAGIEWPNGKAPAKKGAKAGQLPCDRITWKKNKDGVRRDYATALEALRLRAQLLTTAHGEDINRAIIALDKAANEYFANTRATITGAAIRDLIVNLRELATMASKATAVEIPTVGARQFRVPASWKKRAGEE